MKKYFVSAGLVLLLFCETAYAIELKGLQPVDPYGVFSTFSTESFGRGKVAFSTGAEVSLDPDLYRFIMKTAYGLSDVVELDMTLPYVFGSDVRDGFEDVAIGVKHRFFEEGKYGPSLAYIINVSVPTGSERLTTDGRYGAGLIVSKRVGPVNGHMNFFYEKAGTRQLKDEVTFLTGLDFAAAHNFKLLSELVVRKGHDSSDIDLIEGRIGYRIRTTDSIYTSFGAGFDFKRRDPQTRLMFSVTFVTPPEKKKIQKLYEVE
ncbi:MAG TPA: transporter [Thermodesulfovibrionales bacterium]|nr:transporter [Thermodesulfovibrionales bacterium]